MKSFTLVEIIISLAIFTFVLFSLQAFLSSVFSTQFRAVAMKKVADNTRSALEIMGREMRLARGDGSGCTSTGQSFEITSPGPDSGTTIGFIDFSGRCIFYNFDGGTKIISKRIDGGSSQTFIGGDVIVVNDVKFFRVVGPNLQPRIIILVKVQTDDPTSPTDKLDLAVQTTVSQRELNVE